MRTSDAAMMRAGRGFAHGVPMLTRLAPAWVCPGLGVEALNSGAEALISSVEALGFGVEALCFGNAALRFGVEVLELRR